jgi:D-aminoacyl-tRNA deacylase
MIVVLQRVSRAAVRVSGETVSEIGVGVCLFAGVRGGDGPVDAEWLADKIAGLRVFEDAGGRTNLALADVGGAVLLVPQFTLAADWRHGRRPSFSGAAAPDAARELIARLAGRLRDAGLPVAEGRFGADMAVELVNAGPFTVVLDSAERPGARPRPAAATT